MMEKSPGRKIVLFSFFVPLKKETRNNLPAVGREKRRED